MPDTTVPVQTPAEYWEGRYSELERMWSGRVNRVLEDVAASLTPGSALDLGCGEGGDAVWLAQHGWRTTGVDISPTAAERGRKAAADLGLPSDSIDFETGDLTAWNTSREYDLVTSSFLHSWPVTIPREEILHRATRFVAPGGHLLVTSHAAAPSWADPEMLHGYVFPTPQSDLDALQLDSNDWSTDEWDVLACEIREREGSGPDGTTGILFDGVVLVRRKG